MTGLLWQSRAAMARAGLKLALAAATLALAASASHATTFDTSTTVTSTPNPSQIGQSVTFTATVSTQGGGAPTGSVTFNDGVTSLGSGSVSTLGVGFPFAAGDTHTCALTIAGGVKCWGLNGDGQVGDGTTTTPRASPLDVSGLTGGVAAIAAGYHHTCALTTAGVMKCWGDNSSGQLSNGTFPPTDSSTPADVSGLTGVITAMALGQNHTCALTSAGGVKCWGYGVKGQVGQGNGNNAFTPVDVSGLTSGVTAIAAGQNHTCALTSGGGVKCWGENFYLQIGDGTTASQRNSPTDVSGLTSGVVAIAIDGMGNHTCALTSGGGVKCWGYNSTGQLGDGSGQNQSAPVDVTNLTSGVGAIAGGAFHTCAVTTSGGAKCWGTNVNGQVGDGTNLQRNAPVDVSGLTSGVSAITAGGFHTCALTSAAAMKCWGSNGNGQLGDTTTTTRFTQVAVSGLTDGTVRLFGTATLATTSLAAGDRSITASYGGDATNNASTSASLTQTVNKLASSTALDLSPNPSVFGAQVTFTATVTGDGATGTVTFSIDSVSQSPVAVSGGTASLTTSALSVGGHSITAVYNGDDTYFGSTSSSPTQTVNKGSTATTLTVTPASTQPGQQVTLSASVAAVAPAAGARTGSVTFKDGSTTLGTVSLSGNAATLQTSSLAIGTRSLTAVYSGDSHFNASTSAAKTETVNPMVGAEFKVNGSGGGGSANRQAPAIARLSDGSAVVAWEAAVQDGSGIGVYGQRFTSAGAASGSEFRVNTTTANDQKQPAVAGLTSGFVMVWASAQTAAAGLDIYAQRYTNAGAKLGAEFKVNTTATADQSMPAVAGLSDGGFVAVWTSAQTASAGLDIYAQRYNASGVKQGTEFKVNTTTTADQTQPAVAALATGFVVAWGSKQVAAVGFDIYGQRFSPAGAKLGAEFRINTTQPADQTQPQLAKLNDGSFVAVWTSSAQDSSGLGVYAQRFSAAGAKLGSEFRVNTTVARDQSQPSVAAFTDKGFVVVWTSQGQDGSGNGVYGQAFNTAGAKVYFEFRIATTTTGNQSQPRAVAFSGGAFTAVWTSTAVTPQAIVGQRLRIGGL